MALTVLNVAYPLASVGRDAVGGAEQVVSFLDRELVRAGHRSIVVAREDSTCAGTLIPVPAIAGTLDHHINATVEEHCRQAIGHAMETEDINVVHLHGVDFHAHLPPPGPPAIVTLHLPLTWYARGALTTERPDTFLHCVSAAQRGRSPPGVALLPNIENGVPVDELAAHHGRRNYVISLGRICWEKGFHLALEAATDAGVAMFLAGQIFRYSEHEAYFQTQIVPRLDRSRRFIGPVGFARKRRLLTAARALLIPSLVPETGSLVAMEALACGTPVIAFNRGALSRVVDHGVTGFLVETKQQMAEAIHAVSLLDPAACRQAAHERFSTQRMREQYFSLYAKLASGWRPHAGDQELAPVTRLDDVSMRSDVATEGSYAA